MGQILTTNNHNNKVKSLIIYFQGGSPTWPSPAMSQIVPVYPHNGCFYTPCSVGICWLDPPFTGNPVACPPIPLSCGGVGRGPLGPPVLYRATTIGLLHNCMASSEKGIGKKKTWSVIMCLSDTPIYLSYSICHLGYTQWTQTPRRCSKAAAQSSLQQLSSPSWHMKSIMKLSQSSWHQYSYK